MTDTTHFVREDVKAFLAMLEAMNRPGIEELPLAEGRQGMRVMNQLAEAPPRDLPVIRDLSCPGPAGEIPLRLYDSRADRDAATPVIVFFHGGGFVIGDLEVYHSLCTEICATLDLPVVSVDYRLAPEAPFPAAPEDCEAAARWVASNPDDLPVEPLGMVLAGDSAGGNLTIVVTNQLQSRPAAVPIILHAPLYPLADDIASSRSFADFGEGYLLTAPTMAWFSQSYAADANDKRNMPLVDLSPTMPPAVVMTAGLDPLRDSGRNYAAHLIRQGTEVTYLERQGTIHGFANLRKALPSAQQDLAAYLAAIADMLERLA